jgi:hypothetical protein
MEDVLSMSTGSVAVLPVVSGVDYERQKQADADAKAKQLAVGPQSSSLLSYMQKCFTDAKNAKDNSGVTDRLLEAQRRRKGEHSAAKKAQLAKYNLPDYWVPLTQTKCIHTEAWFRDLLMPYGTKIWACDPTEIPELQPEHQAAIEQAVIEEATQAMAGGEMISDMQMQAVIDNARTGLKKAIAEEAKDRAKDMEKLIQDQHEECGFTQVFRDFQANLTTYGTAFFKGPFTIHKKTPKWNGNKRVVEDKVIPSCSAPSPHDMYPAPWATDVNQGYVIERIKTYREGLNAVRKLPYYVRKNIESLLSQRTAPITQQLGDDERASREDKGNIIPDDRFEVFQFSGMVPGYMLVDWGIANVDAAEDYNMEVLWSNSYILKVMPRWDEVRITPYFKACFKVVVGSFWGVGVPLLMSASQDRGNAMQIAMIDNTGWAGGPIGWIDLTRLVNPGDAKDIHPHKFIPVQSQIGQTGPPMGFANVEMHVNELMVQYRQCETDSDNESGVPAYTYGSGSTSPAAATATGLHTLMNAAAKGIKDALLAVDQALSAFIQSWADWNNQYSDNESVKGDIRVVCSGSTGMFVSELAIAKIDETINQAIPLMPLLGPRFLVDLFRQKAKMLKMNHQLLPTDDELKQAAMQPPVPPQGGDQGGMTDELNKQGMMPGEPGASLPPATVASGAQQGPENNVAPIAPVEQGVRV